MLTAAFYTFGCRLNQTETAIMAKGLEDNGYRIIQDLRAADLCVINTCTVTDQSDAKCLQKIRSVKRSNPNAVIAVVGCFSQVASEKIRALGEIDLIIGNQEKLHLAGYVSRYIKNRQQIVDVRAIFKDSFSIETTGQYLSTTRANLKIQDGCDFICSFCIIPKARGRARSREIENLRQEGVALAQMGVKEIILTGVNIGTYEYNGLRFIDLFEIFNAIEGIERIRISSIEPTTIGVEILSLMKQKAGKLVPHLHLPLQSSDDGILSAMRRRYRFEEYLEFVQNAVEQVPSICIGSDIITGFPGETDAVFQDSLKRLQDSPIHYFHVFPYTVRKGTTSAKMSGAVESDAINRRAASLRKLSDRKRTDFARSFIGKELNVLFEHKHRGSVWQGYSENYIRVTANSGFSLGNEIRRVKLESVDNGKNMGSLI